MNNVITFLTFIVGTFDTENKWKVTKQRPNEYLIKNVSEEQVLILSELFMKTQFQPVDQFQITLDYGEGQTNLIHYEEIK